MKADILVLDDDRSVRVGFRRLLTSAGYRVSTAESYQEALSCMDEKEFDLILADMILGDRCGLDILQEVTRRKLGTRVIIMTAFPSMTTINASFRMQAFDYLTKPPEKDELLNCISKALLQGQQPKGPVRSNGSN
jgi:two-component system response regulator GlrR